MILTPATGRDLTVIGGGIVGRSAAWHLQQRGWQVGLIDPDLAGSNPTSGSQAALGLLMAQVFHRASGRAWTLRQRSLALWEQWIDHLQRRGHPVRLNHGLLLLASTADELERQRALVQARQAQGLPLELWSHERLAALQPQLPPALGAVWSPADGQLDPGPVLQALLHELRQAGAQVLPQAVEALERCGDGRWQLHLADGSQHRSAAVVVCAGAGTAPLLRGLGFELPLQPVLGQALALAPAAGAPTWRWGTGWPAAAVWQGINLVPRPDGQLWLGATLEPGTRANAAALDSLANLQGQAPPWLQQAQRLRQWQGLRLRPDGRGAPWLEPLAPGLLLAGGHYRNGLLLAPATAEWIAAQLDDG
ncbi:MAG: FAD-dependent oxidoreductase [Cyanobacteriota bacterium]|nr:FAD-dependent oxidoreductase [Cyanobacteriota bacterium]